MIKKFFLIILKWADENEAIDNRIIPLYATGTLKVWCIWLEDWVFNGQIQKREKKKKNRGSSNMEFPGVTKKKNVEFPGVNEK